MSFILDQTHRPRRTPSLALKGFFGFATLALAAVNLFFGAFGSEAGAVTQSLAALIGGILGIALSYWIANQPSSDE